MSANIRTRGKPKLDPDKFTVHGKPRKVNARPLYTQSRWALRQITWEPVKRALQRHFLSSPTGEMSRMAECLGLQPSQLHRFSCNECEHNQEPGFVIGMSILMYLVHYQRRLGKTFQAHNPTHKNQFEIILQQLQNLETQTQTNTNHE